MIYDLTPFSDDNNKFVSIFYKILKGEATPEEIDFAKEYAKESINKLP